jgi:diaminopimelate decarboxylase
MSTIRSSYTDSLHFFGNNTPQQLVAVYGSPLYVYNEKILRRSCRDMRNLSAHPGFRVNYAAKANSNPALLRIIRDEGCLVEAMSPGELHMALHAGFLPEQILYACINVAEEELKNALD